MDFNHETVLLEATVDAVRPRAGGRYIDATLGGGGHTSLLLLRSAPTGQVMAFDQDETAIQNANVRFRDVLNRLMIVHSNFREMGERARSLGFEAVDGIVFDLGVSSPQFDIAERGFSYRYDGPLDMRMDRRQTMTAETFVNEADQEELARVFFRYGEEKFSRPIARRIVEARAEHRITSTLELADLIKSAIPAAARRTGPHPARRVFQAIRIAVNDELGVLETGLEAAFSLLAPGGRMAVISFHSLEDRIVKQTFRDFATGCICPPELPICTCGRTPSGKLVTRKPIEPSEAEQTHNPRARSAKLRVIEKI
ncbi:16S rRNA (cytosine(1402)-N(4))-methyltransferase RsmH [Alicyclobacillus fastidiosus]|uniref:Ribosomal RNA small subunit methyltransferase H n=1 Tax=Alicyclobacillus fastidiosus TaxID=392011 RepID=A0ABY6ZC30_9BACL|nr:16S rRNA (cytosine(1402)-N(4))-methyltransferase RsmH [Alicyclobacillus fastidiosus]WAH40444.1 16S rRNA (cytosine(1402)-N(4))-methyltransferase RsmH [Alicyclobacillus fastidiosus]GMA61846.1 ribosomal RNA small subunit methyltransferase H [Alicyclobacillus fastidiosus]